MCVPSLCNLFRAISFDLVTLVTCVLADLANLSASTPDRTKAPERWVFQFFLIFLDFFSVISTPRTQCYPSSKMQNICSHVPCRDHYDHCSRSCIPTRSRTKPVLSAAYCLTLQLPHLVILGLHWKTLWDDTSGLHGKFLFSRIFECQTTHSYAP